MQNIRINAADHNLCGLLSGYGVYKYILACARDLYILDYICVDSRVALTLSVVLEQKLDGSFMGLSSFLSADAFTFSEPMILDQNSVSFKSFTVWLQLVMRGSWSRFMSFWLI